MSTKWYENPWIWGGLLGVGGLYVYSRYNNQSLTFTVSDPIMRGQKLSSTVLSHGIIPDDPEILRQQASIALGRDISNDVLALARMIRSEGASQGELRGHVALNDLNDLGWTSLFYLLTYATDNRKGHYGEQYAPADNIYPSTSVRRYSTSRDPYAGDVYLAEKILNDRAIGIDKANGATKFVDKNSFGVQEGTGSYADLEQKWEADGLQPFSLPEYGTDIVLFKKG